MSGITIAGLGKYVPEKTVTNDDMAKIVDTSDEWISKRTGIKERRFSSGEPNFYMGTKASQMALKNAGLDGSDIDMIIGCTITPDYFYPQLACIVQDEINADGAWCWDLNAACSGFVYAADVARHYLESEKKNVLIVCSENMSKVTDFEERSTCVLFGDAAAAAVLKPASGAMYGSSMKSEGKLGGSIISRALPNIGPYAVNKDDPKYNKYMKAKSHYLTMTGGDVYRFAVTEMPNAVEKACEKAGISVSDLDVIVPHQANRRIIETAAKRLGVGMDKMYVNIDRFGNTSCVTIPLALCELQEMGRLRRGDKVCITGFGAGLTCGAIVMEW